jgi:benzodiazapine receptor
MNRSIADWGGNILAFVLVIVANGMANGVPLGGQTTGEISAKYPSLFTPAGYVFSIWGLIYLGLLIFVIWQALPEQRTNKNLAAIRIPFLINCASNAIWIFMWHYDLLVLSLVLMLVILGSLIQIYRTLNIGLSNAPAAERWIAHLPFSIYTGWITVATIANLSAFQINQGWDDLGFEAVTWTIIKIGIAGTVAATVLFRRRDVAFVLVAVWASTGIAAKHAASPMVAGAASVIAILGVLLIVSEYLSRSRSA